MPGQRVRATGSVRVQDGQLVLVPTGPATDAGYALTLRGANLPTPGERVVVEGQLVDTELHASGWRPEPSGTSGWSAVLPPGIIGTDKALAGRIADSVSEDWPIISVGELQVQDRMAVVLEVVRATQETEAWLVDQPPGAVWLVPFKQAR